MTPRYKISLVRGGLFRGSLSNLFFAFRDFDYFNEVAMRDAFLHTWSLGVEEQFYLIWPLVLFAALRLGHLAPQKYVTRTMLLIFMLSFGGSVWLSMYSSTLAFYLMPTRMWEFVLGALVFLTQGENLKVDSSRTQQIGRWLLWGSIGFLLTSAVVLHENLAYPALWALAPALAAALLILAGGITHQPSFLALPGMVWIGDRSYALYLWHWPMLKLGSALGMAADFAGVAGIVLLTIVFADVSYRFVERPLWKTRLQSVTPRHVILLSLLMMLLVLALWRAVEHELEVRIPPAPVALSGRGDMPVIYAMGCDGFTSTAKLQPCVFNADDYRKTAVLIGDSIGAQWFSAIQATVSAPEWRLIVLTKSSCAFIDEEYDYKGAGGAYKVCFEWRDKVLDYVKSIKPNLVIVGSTASYGFSDEQWREGSARYFARLSAAADQVVAIAGAPWLSFDGPSCIARHIDADGRLPDETCREVISSQKPAKVASLLNQAAARFSNVHILDPAPLVCPDNICRAMTEDGVAVYRDTQHLTDSFVRALAPGFGALVSAHLE